MICTGDFQAVRNLSDLESMAVPEKYKDMGTFYKYYNGEKLAPVLTIFIGGNHESSLFCQELPEGGWVAPNIYYMGYSTIINFCGIRIAGISGIYNSRHYRNGHFEKPPYTKDTLRSVYHMREVEVFKLLNVAEPIDIMLSHDWPTGIYNHGDINSLLSKKPFFRKEVELGILGNPATEKLLHKLQPDYWFSSHLHVKFSALVKHDSGKITKFLSLDKCMPFKDYFQLIEMPKKNDFEKKLYYDKEWLAIIKSTYFLCYSKKYNLTLPNEHSEERKNFNPTPKELEEIDRLIENLEIPLSFIQTAHPYYQQEDPNPQLMDNPQTQKLQQSLELIQPTIQNNQENNPEELIIDL